MRTWVNHHGIKSQALKSYDTNLN